jgi:hypothetical protein
LLLLFLLALLALLALLGRLPMKLLWKTPPGLLPLR